MRKEDELQACCNSVYRMVFGFNKIMGIVKTLACNVVLYNCQIAITNIKPKLVKEKTNKPRDTKKKEK